uniref:Ig-like domain-containing protein n=1 Tax=Salmo trutta TaxID=8032 RepID=A0A673YFY5_SALTR
MISLQRMLGLFMLMLLHGAPITPGTMTTLPATAKPTVVTFPLELNPPRVVVRYGDSVSVNCSTSSTDHEGMGWEATFGGTNFEQDVNIVTWTVDNLTDWTIEPKCYITLIDDEQASKVLPVILYKTPDSISISVLRHSGAMVEGTEYQLQCDIQNMAPLQNLVVKWYKGNEPLDHVTYSNVSKTPVDVSATLMISPSRHDDGAQYRCRAELDLGPEGPQPHPTVTSEPLSITVHYAPEFLLGNDTVEVSAGSDVSLNCSAEGNPPPELRWTNNTAHNVKSSTEGRQRTIRITKATSTNAGIYICTATNRVGTATRTTTVTMKGGSTSISLTIVIIFPVIFLIFLIVFFMCKKRQGFYNFIPVNQPNDVPLMPLPTIGVGNHDPEGYPMKV